MSFSSSGSKPQDITVAVAAAGNSLATATALITEWNVITSGTGTSADGVLLPKAITGRVVRIINKSGAIIEIWPTTGDTEAGGSASAEAVIPLLDDDSRSYIAISGSEASTGVAAVAGDWLPFSDDSVIA